MINVVAWWVNTASGTIYTAISAFGICQFLIPGFVGTQWQVYLCYLLVIFITCKFTIFILFIRLLTGPSFSISYLRDSPKSNREYDENGNVSINPRVLSRRHSLSCHGERQLSSQQPGRVSFNERLGSWSRLVTWNRQWGICIRRCGCMCAYRGGDPESKPQGSSRNVCYPT